jgi:hypothetical protein
MWKTLNYLENILENVDQKAAQTLKGKEEDPPKRDTKQYNEDLETKIREIHSNEKNTPEEAKQKEHDLYRYQLILV